MYLQVETDKRLNVYRIWEGNQIILCKNSPKGTIVNNIKWITLWPSKSGETKMIRRKPPTEVTEFFPSDKGYNLLIQNRNKTERENQFIASVEYIPCNAKSIRLWEKLMAIGEFELWDIVLGPLKYFKNKRKCYIALYRLFKMPVSISQLDIVPDKNGNLPNFHKKIKGYKKSIIFENIDSFLPIISEEVFNIRRNKIKEIINETFNDQPFNYNVITKYLEDKYQEKLSQIPEPIASTIYCIFCGEELPTIANFCSQCGKPLSNKN